MCMIARIASTKLNHSTKRRSLVAATAISLCAVFSTAAAAAPGSGKSGSNNPGAAVVVNTPAADKARAGGQNAAENGVAHSDKNSGESEESDDPDDGDGSKAGAHVTASAFLAGTSTTTSYLRFVNSGSKSGFAVVRIYDSATGAALGSWNSIALPASASLGVAVGDIAAHATPALTAEQAARPLDLAVNAGFKGAVQHIGAPASGPVNLSACGRDIEPAARVLGNVAGPGHAALTDAVRIVNAGVRAGTVILALHSAVDGTKLGVWTSPDVPANGSLTVSASEIAASATPTVAPAAAELTVVADHLGAGLRLEHLSKLIIAGSFADLTNACRLQSSASTRTGDAGEDTGDDEGDDEGDDSGDDDSSEDDDGDGDADDGGDDSSGETGDL